MARRVEEVFVTEGVPEVTFVRPPNFGEILLDVRRAGKPVIIEGQSGTGKTTCLRKVIAEIAPDVQAQYLTARKPADVEEIQKITESRPARMVVIDDFHRLSEDLRSKLADLAKMAADEASDGARQLKLVLIGINQVGSDLIQLVPDIAKRTGIHRIQPGTAAGINGLIQSGCEALNIEIENRAAVFQESKGDYWLTQQLCQSICTMNGVDAASAHHKQLSFDVPTLRNRVVDRLRNAYYPAVKEFCRGQRFRPTNDPYFKLLRAIREQESSVVDLNELANAQADVRGSINNIKEHRLAVLIESKPICAKHFYYNQETKNFAIEDPALFYFLKHLDWNALRSDCGFRESARDFEYDFALSFAGENRDLARAIAESLETLDCRVFFDEYFEGNFLGRTWGTEFKRIFSLASRLVVCLLDTHHAQKIWPTFERDCFTPRVPQAEVIPIYLDDTVFVGIPRDIVRIDFKWDRNDPTWKDRVIDAIVFKLMERLN